MFIERSNVQRKMTFRERLDTIKSVFTGLPNQSLLSMSQRFFPMYGEPPKRSTADWIDLYNKSPRLNPVHQIASDVACSAYGIFNNDDPKKIKLLNSNPVKLLKKPNTDLTITEYVLFYITEVYLLMNPGEAFWIIESNGLRKPSEIWPVPPHWVQSIPSSSSPYYTIYPQGNMQSSPISVLPEDMIYFKRPDVKNPYLRGMGRTEGIGDELETDEYMAKFAKRYFLNDAVPSMIVQMPGADEATVNRTEETWNTKFGGYNNKHKTAFVNWELKAQLLKETYKEMDFIESRKYLRDATIQHFSIPPEIFGILENSNRATISASWFLYTKNILRKELKFIGDTLNLQFIPKFANDIYFEYENIVPADDEFELKKASEGLKNGGITVNEWRRKNGWEDLPGDKGEIMYTPLNMIPTSITGDGPLPTNLPPVTPEPPALVPEPTKQTKNASEELKKVKQIIKSLTKKERDELGSRYFYDDSQYRYIEHDEDKPIAFIENRSTGKKGHFNIAVHSEYRGNGIAKKIIKNAIRVLEETDLEKIFWITSIANEPSINLAKKNGFEFYEEEDGKVKYVYYFNKEKQVKALTPEHKERIWHIFDKAAVKYERSFINATKKFFQAQQDKVNKSLSKSIKEITDNPDDILNWTEENGILLATLSPLWIASLTEGYEMAEATYGFGISFDVMNPKFLDWVKANGLDKAKGINETTKEGLRKTLSEGIANGEGIPGLRDRVSAVYGDAKGYRATLIARTETMGSVNFGNMTTLSAANIKKHSWLATTDSRTRDTHLSINGEIVEVGAMFSNGLLYPGDPGGDAFEVCNCRCTTIPEFED